MRRILACAIGVGALSLAAPLPAAADPGERACAHEPHGTERAHMTVRHNTEGNHRAHMSIPHYCSH